VVAFQFGQFLYECTEEFMLKNVCGTFFEVHRPFDSTILFSYQELSKLAADTLFFTTMTTDNLCSGKYEVYVATYQRSG